MTMTVGDPHPGCTCYQPWVGMFPQPPCPVHCPPCQPQTWTGTTLIPYVSSTPELSDKDIERIAKKLAEILDERQKTIEELKTLVNKLK